MTNGISYRRFNLKNFWPLLLLLILGGAIIAFIMHNNLSEKEEGVELKEIFKSDPNDIKIGKEERKENVAPITYEKKKEEIKAPVVQDTSNSSSSESSDKSSHPFTIQVASFRQQSSAKSFLGEAKKKGHPAYMESRDLKEKGTYWRIYVGTFQTKSQADEYIKNSLSDHKGSFVIVRD